MKPTRMINDKEKKNSRRCICLAQRKEDRVGRERECWQVKNICFPDLLLKEVYSFLKNHSGLLFLSEKYEGEVCVKKSSLLLAS